MHYICLINGGRNKNSIYRFCLKAILLSKSIFYFRNLLRSKTLISSSFSPWERITKCGEQNIYITVFVWSIFSMQWHLIIRAYSSLSFECFMGDRILMNDHVTRKSQVRKEGAAIYIYHASKGTWKTFAKCIYIWTFSIHSGSCHRSTEGAAIWD
jgi:hypothetical protein